jgi:hypothetical protein
MASQSQGFLQVITETNVQIISLQLIRLHRWENNIKMLLKEVWSKGVNWIHLTHDKDQLWAVINTVTKPWVWNGPETLAMQILLSDKGLHSL